jgi:hypothetical protein
MYDSGKVEVTRILHCKPRNYHDAKFLQKHTGSSQINGFPLEFQFWAHEGRASDRGRIGILYVFKMPKTHWR